MRACFAWIVFACAWPAGGARAVAQDAHADELVELRVSSARPRWALVDRGRNARLVVGDRIVFLPRGGGRFEGTLSRVDERSALVQLDDPNFVPEAGTRAEVRIPAARRAVASEPEPEPSSDAPAARHEWKNDDAGWTQDKPLLAQVRPVRPNERPLTISGRVYAIGDYAQSSEDDRSDGFYRVGTALLYDNLTGHGDRLNIDAELNYRNTDVPDADDEQKTRVRLDRLSYSWGGTRFAPERWEFGRFLQGGMPEFGVLDGMEWRLRSPGANEMGLSVGFLPTQDAEMETGDDLQLAGYYRWNNDESETLSAAIGYQKSYHHLDADRDLVVANLRWLPPRGWSFQATAWIDIYGDGDAEKGAGAELTQAWANLTQRDEDGSSRSLSYSHMAFPETEQSQLAPASFAALADDHNDRLALFLRQRLSTMVSVRTELGGWVDQEDEGGDAELGFELEDVLVHGGLFELSAFGTWARFETAQGARGALGLRQDDGSWRLSYELRNHHLDGFSDDNDDLPQHRARLERDFHSPSGWSFALHAEAGLWDNEHSLAAGFFLQRSF